MSNSLLNQFNTGGSPLAIPPSPTSGVTPDSVSMVGFSQLHNQYSNLGDPMLTQPAYQNFGASTIAYTNPQTSQFGLSANDYQANEKYKDNPPAGAHF